MKIILTILVLTGDSYEEFKIDYTISNIFFTFIKECEKFAIEVHIILGNHDLKRTGSHYISPLDLIATSIFPIFIYIKI